MQKIVERSLQPIIEKWLFRGKTIVLYGQRQVGKTTLAKAILAKNQQADGYFNCEIQSVRSALEVMEPTMLKRFIGNKKIVVFDEAQNIPAIGSVLKLLNDTFPELQVIATGSSIFELANKSSEPLTGRALQFTLLPLSYQEIGALYPPLERRAQLEHFLKFGMYPEIVMASEEEAGLLLDDLTSKYLYKDILAFENLRHSNLLHKLLQLLALQIGSEVSYNELANSIQLNVRTVERYIDLLEKAFVIFRLPPFSRNMRKEITKKNKIFFYDIGIRNSIVRQYQSIDLRMDKGSVWENFFIVERLKYLQSRQLRPNLHFWRTHDQQELDLLEDMDGKLIAYEIKWSQGKGKIPSAFEGTYPGSTINFINTSNFEEFIE
jgi:predicted AAA+ superfamily ATPase